MLRIVVNNLSELKSVSSKIKAVSSAFSVLQKKALDKAANDIILKEIKNEMRANNFSDKIIDATFVGRTELIGDKLRTRIISNYVSDTGFDVSSAREEGTKDHIVIPKRPDGTLRWKNGSNKPIFRKFSRPKGIERLLIIEKTIKKNQNAIEEEYQNNLAATLSSAIGA